MEKIKFKEVYEMLESGKINPYSFYMVDNRIDQVLAVDYYLKHPNDNITTTQKISKVFFDIEVFTNNEHIDVSTLVERGSYLVNALTFYNSKNNKYTCLFIPPNGCKLTQKDFEEHLNKEGHTKTKVSDTEEKYDTYLDEGQSVEVILFNDGVDLVKYFFKCFHEIDPCVLSGWNADFFDTFYLYNYLLYHLKSPEAVANIFSKYGEIYIEESPDRSGKRVKLLKCPDWILLDYMFAYKPRDAGGLNLGKTLASYALNSVAYEELGMKKLEYKSEGLTLDQFYIKDPLNFLLYNLYDVCLVQKLDKKMGLIELYNLMRRFMNCTASSSLKGSTPLFDTYIYRKMREENTYVRYGVRDENSFGVSKSEREKIRVVKGETKIKWDIDSISSRDCMKLITRYVGAYVKTPNSGIYSTGTISDLDKCIENKMKQLT